MATENDDADFGDEAEDFAESLAIAHHLAILDLIEVIRNIDGAPAEKLDTIRTALVELLPPEDIEVMG